MFLMRIFIFSFLFLGCVYGPKSEKKSPLNHLNGEHYETNNNGGTENWVIPILKRKQKKTKIEGIVSLRSGDSLLETTPLRHISLVLIDSDENEILKFHSQSDGSFSLLVPLENGSYKVLVQSKKYEGEVNFSVSSYNVKNLILYVTSKT